MISIEELYACYLRHPEVSTDSRQISKGGLFFALKGEHFNANHFAKEALEKGAAYVIVDEELPFSDSRFLRVPEVLAALQALAAHHRKQLTIPVIGLTGSNGKTTTKELIKSVLLQKFNVFATKGNLNNHIGVPLSLLAIGPDIEIAVIEMGANHQQEIAFLCSLAAPTQGLITNVGLAHLEGFGGFEGVKKGKAELYGYLKEHGGLAFVHADNPYLIEMQQAAGLLKLDYYGHSAVNRIQGKLKESDPFISIEWKSGEGVYQAETQLTGAYNFENMLAAICVGDYFGLSGAEIRQGLMGYVPSNNRSQLTETKWNKVICDFYNANPSSMEAALLNLEKLAAPHKVAIIGDMLELGPESPMQHERIVQKAAQLHVDECFFIGPQFLVYQERYPGKYFENPASAMNHLQQYPLHNRLILLKGSRGMALEKLLPLL